MVRADQQDRLALRGRLLLLVLGVLALAAGAWTGLSRIGVPLPAPPADAIASHGALMIGGALGTLIGIERAVALGQRWAFAAPLASGLGGISALFALSPRVSTSLLLLASLIFTAASARIVVRQAASFTVVMLLGAAAWAAGNLAWSLGVAVDRLVLLWAAFLLLTIAGERLELSRLRAPPRSALWTFAGAVTLLAAGAIAAVSEPELGQRVAGTSFIALALWLGRHDLARRTLKTSGLPRFAAASVLSGYVWLGVSGVILLLSAPLAVGPIYDAMLHALFLGFVFSMIFGHAPIILPAVLRIELPFGRLLYAPLGLLHVSVALRIIADLFGLATLRTLAGTLNVVTLITFALCVVYVKVA